MSDDRDVQDWFKRSVEQLPGQPFTLEILAHVRRRELYWQLQRYAAWLVAFSSVCLVVSELITPINMLASLPLTVIEASGEQWPVLVVTTIGIVYWLVKRARNASLLRRA